MAKKSKGGKKGKVNTFKRFETPIKSQNKQKLTKKEKILRQTIASETPKTTTQTTSQKIQSTENIIIRNTETKTQLPNKSIWQTLKKIWWFIWEDNSIWSWIVNIILAFVIIKFLVYPGLGLAFGTNYPIVAVVSGSMEHDGNFEEWWNSPAACDKYICAQEQWYEPYNIKKSEFEKFIFMNGFNKGDIIFLRGVKPEKINVGDVLVFMTPYKKEPIIHRVVKIIEEKNEKSQTSIKIYQTKGDHNIDSGKYDYNISEANVIGRAWVRVPYLGWIKIGFVNLLGLFGINIS